MTIVTSDQIAILNYYHIITTSCDTKDIYTIGTGVSAT